MGKHQNIQICLVEIHIDHLVNRKIAKYRYLTSDLELKEYDQNQQLVCI